MNRVLPVQTPIMEKNKLFPLEFVRLWPLVSIGCVSILVCE